MKVSASKYCDGVESIYIENPDYELGHDGSDGKCDCIGMPRGALERAGATDVRNMRGTNQAARKTIENLQNLKSESQLRVGDVVLKTRDPNDANYPLPDRYRKGGADYDPTWGETNFTHIGTVTHVNPIEITHMTSPKAKKDKSIKGWSFYGELPWVEYGSGPEPGPDPQEATVYSENGRPVKMRQKPSTSCKMYDEVPCGEVVEVLTKDCTTDKAGNVWSKISYGSRTGWYMMSRFLIFDEPVGTLYTVTIPNLMEDQANNLLAMYPGSWKTPERGDLL